MKIRLNKLAALVECLQAVDLRKVSRIRKALRHGALIPPVRLLPLNRQGFYVLNDGHHRTIAYYLENRRVIPVTIDKKLKPISLSWRWPLVSPVRMALDLMSLTISINRR